MSCGVGPLKLSSHQCFKIPSLLANQCWGSHPHQRQGPFSAFHLGTQKAPTSIISNLLTLAAQRLFFSWYGQSHWKKFLLPSWLAGHPCDLPRAGCLQL